MSGVRDFDVFRVSLVHFRGGLMFRFVFNWLNIGHSFKNQKLTTIYLPSQMTLFFFLFKKRQSL